MCSWPGPGPGTPLLSLEVRAGEIAHVWFLVLGVGRCYGCGSCRVHELVRGLCPVHTLYPVHDPALALVHNLCLGLVRGLSPAHNFALAPHDEEEQKKNALW